MFREQIRPQCLSEVDKSVYATIPVTASAGNSAQSLALWILWSTVDILIDSTNPPNAPAHYPFPEENGIYLGPFTNGVTVQAAETTVVTLLPPGVGQVVTRGWHIFQNKSLIVFTNDIKMTNEISEPDDPGDASTKVTPDSEDKIYAIDTPGLIMQTQEAEMHANFATWAWWAYGGYTGGTNRCSEDALWNGQFKYTNYTNIVYDSIKRGTNVIPSTPTTP